MNLRVVVFAMYSAADWKSDELLAEHNLAYFIDPASDMIIMQRSQRYTRRQDCDQHTPLKRSARENCLR